MEELLYKNATLKDLPEIVALYNATIPGRMVTADTTPVTVDSKKIWFHEHQPEKRPLWMVENKNNDTIGWVSFQSFYGRPAYDITAEISIYLNEVFQGKGFGRKILNYSMEHCYRFGIKNLLGFIFAHNKKSLNLFHSSGFETWGTLPSVAVIDEIERTLIIVGKRIGKS